MPEPPSTTACESASLASSLPQPVPLPASLPVPMTLPADQDSPAKPAGEATLAATPTAVVDEAPHFWLRRGDQAFVALLAFCGLLLLCWQAVRIAGWNRPLVEIERLPARQYEFRVEINRASWIEWAQLDGIGEILAKRIVDDRTERGPFRSIDDVQRVRGIGPKKLDQIRPWLEYSESNH